LAEPLQNFIAFAPFKPKHNDAIVATDGKATDVTKTLVGGD
jgi:hypothetical protein